MSAGASTGVAETQLVKLTAKDFKGKVDPDWCPGLRRLRRAGSLQSASAPSWACSRTK